MTNLPPWSYSALDTFMQCPRKYYHRYILKEKEPETEAQAAGNRFDKAIEARVRDDAPLPEEFRSAEPMAASIAGKRAGAKLVTQLKMGLTRDFTPCGFFAPGVWARGVIDVGLITYPNALIMDWKTGKNNESKDFYTGLQLKIFTAMLFKHFPKVYNITAFNIYVKDGKPGNPMQWRSVDQAQLWRDILPPVLALEKACAKEEFPEKPSGICGFCPVKTCKHNRS